MSTIITFKNFILETITKTDLAYHPELNPKLWENDHKLIPKVSERLKEITKLFIETLDIDSKFIKDYILTGSICNYNYTNLSDIDIHVVVDFSKIKGRIKPEDYFYAIKSNWNFTHNIKIYGHDVELYVSDFKDNLVGDSAAYSLKYNKWIQEPKQEIPKYNQTLIKLKANHFANLIDKQLKLHYNDKEELKKLSDKLNKYRRSGLKKKGEFGLENLVFKVLRNNNYVTKLRNAVIKAEDSKLNLEYIEEN